MRAKGRKDVVDVTLSFLVTKKGDTLTGEFVQAVAFDDEGPHEVPLDAGDAIIPVYPVLADDGTQTPVPSQDAADVLTLATDSDLRIASTRAPPGDWIVGFLATDLADNRTFAGIPITIK